MCVVLCNKDGQFKSLLDIRVRMACAFLNIFILLVSIPQELFNQRQISETPSSLFYNTLGAAGCSGLYFYSPF